MRLHHSLPLAGAVVGLAFLAGAGTDSRAPAHYWCASDLPDMAVYSPGGVRLGEIEDVIVRSGGGRPAYAVVAFGQIDGLRDRRVAIPWGAFAAPDSSRDLGRASDLRGSNPSVRSEDAAREPSQDDAQGQRRLVLDLHIERLSRAPYFAASEWPDLSKTAWFAEIDAFFAQDSTRAGTPAAGDKRAVEASAPQSDTVPVASRMSAVRGISVYGPGGEKLGDISEMILDRQGRVCYAVVSSGGFLGLGERHVAVPWGAFRFAASREDPEGMRITMDTSKDVLSRAPEFRTGKEHRLQMFAPDYIDSVYRHFDERPYWENESDRSARGLQER